MGEPADSHWRRAARNPGSLLSSQSRPSRSLRGSFGSRPTAVEPSPLPPRQDVLHSPDLVLEGLVAGGPVPDRVLDLVTQPLHERQHLIEDFTVTAALVPEADEFSRVSFHIRQSRSMPGRRLPDVRRPPTTKVLLARVTRTDATATPHRRARPSLVVPHSP